MTQKKKTEIVAKDPKHKRFYVFRHKMVGEDQLVENLKVGNFWGPAFEDAWLIADYGKAVELATQAGKMIGGDDGFTYVIGAVDVVVDGFFVLQVIKK